MSLTNESLFQRGLAVIPGGVNSPVRAFRSVGGVPYFVDRAEGAYVWDVEGRRFIDYVQSYGASILGHAHPSVIEAIRSAAGRGTTYGAPTPGEVELAERIVERIPGLEQVRLVSSGTEATMSAIRLARGVTRRNVIVKFAGNYHGHSDALLAAAGSGVALSTADSAGVTPGAIADTRIEPYNVVPKLDDSVAVVVVEPVAANMGLVPPAPGFLEGLRAECDRVGALLLFDEVITGFRVGPAGATGRYGVRPDLWCFGKIIGGGLPVGAFAASVEIMGELAPVGSVYQAGTLSGNPLATAAGRTVLAELTPDAYEELEAKATALATGIRLALASHDIAAQVPRVGPLVGLFLGPDEVRNFDEARAAVARGGYATLFHALLEQGIAIAPGPYEVMFPSLSHSTSDLERTVEAFHLAAERLAADRLG